MAIRRFVCKWGSLVEIFSDNGTNFVGANSQLHEQMKTINDACCETFTDARTKWSFNPASAPHMGGIWERMVRSVKETIRALDDGRKLNDEILLTVLSETEDIINARPLTYMSQDPTECEALTPNHILFGESARTHTELREPVNLAEALRSSYKRSQFLSHVAWDHWLKEYFPTVNRRPKWFEEAKQVKVEDLVYVAEGGRRSWVRGRVEEVITVEDRRVRQAVVQTTTGRLVRPVVKLAVMEVTSGPYADTGFPEDPRGGGCSGDTAALGVSE
ncbi:uncharacterized protein LOC128736706 [Sabethes cyaneus]|uniref:uncharacterized protein LOC128736706 n=1 Tax=Sabethes cyaneus TaxID=53552 RepID=UPI00237DE1C3|nr:uncharacterized protein LOC128736706 [Sabethes cyaneus]